MDADTTILSPVQNRRSRKIAPVATTGEECAVEDLVDVEDERMRSRQQQTVEEEIDNLSRSNARLSISEKSVSDHVQSCIQLAAENKINPKNAFSFKLIDLLHSMFSKKKPIKDFTAASSSLDAGVKIYSCRVDNVHSDTLKMATTVCSSNKARHEEDEERGTDVGETKKRKTIRRTKKNTIGSAKDIDRPAANEGENCPYSILTNDNFITSSAIFDANKVCWHLNTRENFWENEKRVRYEHKNVSINFPDVPDDAVICSTFKNFQFGDDTSFVEPPPVEEKVSNVNYEPPNEDEVFDGDDVFQNDDDIEDYEASNHGSLASQNHIACLSRMMSSSDFVSEISRLIASETSDYRYFNFQQLRKKMNARNTQHWAPLRKTSTNEEKRTKEEKQEPIDFLNDNDDAELKKAFASKKDPSCTLSTAVSREKFLVVPITDFSVNKFFRLSVWRDMFVIPNAKDAEDGPSELDDMIGDYNYDNPNDTLNTLPERYEDDYCDEDVNEISGDVHETIEKTVLLKDNLIELPNKVAKIQLPYMVKDKSVNMKELKSKIWNEIEATEVKEENECTNKTITFVDICKKIIFDENESKEDLSIPIMFNAILQLANDKTLAFCASQCDQTNFIISVDLMK